MVGRASFSFSSSSFLTASSIIKSLRLFGRIPVVYNNYLYTIFQTFKPFLFTVSTSLLNVSTQFGTVLVPVQLLARAINPNNSTDPFEGTVYTDSPRVPGRIDWLAISSNGCSLYRARSTSVCFFCFAINKKIGPESENELVFGMVNSPYLMLLNLVQDRQDYRI